MTTHEDRVRRMRELCEGDPLNRDTPGWHAVRLQEYVADMPLSPNAPELTRALIKTAKNLCVSGFFHYDVFTVAVHYACIAGEGALRDWAIHQFKLPIVLRHRKDQRVAPITHTVAPDTSELFEALSEDWFLEERGKEFRGKYKQLVDLAREREQFTDDDKEWWLTNAEIRNPLAHGSYTILPPAFATGTIRSMIMRINRLFPHPDTDAHDEALRKKWEEQDKRDESEPPGVA